MGNGVQIGLKDLYYALLTSDVAGNIAYEAPVKIAGAITANINPNASNETLFADDGPMETASTIGQISLEMSVSDLPIEVQAILLGHTISGGVLLRKSGDVPPWVAIGFKSLKSNGKYRFVWLVKGKFNVPEMNHETKGDSVAFQTPTIQGSFVKRDGDDVWQKMADEDSADYVASIGTNWFLSVEGAVDTTPPTVSSVTPLDGASGVAANTAVTWTFSEAIQAASVTAANFFVYADGTGAMVDGALALSADKLVVTFTPASNLAAATKYVAIATANIKDLKGNAMADAHVHDFTTI